MQELLRGAVPGGSVPTVSSGNCWRVYKQMCGQKNFLCCRFWRLGLTLWYGLADSLYSQWWPCTSDPFASTSSVVYLVRLSEKMARYKTNTWDRKDVPDMQNGFVVCRKQWGNRMKPGFFRMDYEWPPARFPVVYIMSPSAVSWPSLHWQHYSHQLGLPSSDQNGLTGSACHT